MSYILTEEQGLIGQTAQEFAQEYIGPVASDIDKSGVHPEEVFGQLAGNDFLGLCMPSEYGGGEAGYLSYILTVEELAKISGGVAAALATHVSSVSYTINAFGTKEQKETYLPALCSGEKLGGFAIAEPGAAVGVGANKVVAVKDGDSYLLSGKKSYVANGGSAGLYVVFAVVEGKGLSAFVVDGKAQGLTVSRLIGKMGLRGCQSADLDFANVKADLLGAEGEGAAIAAAAQAAIGVAEGAMVVGLAQAAMDDAAQYSQERIQFGRPIAKFPAIQTMLAEMATNIYMLRLAVYDAAAMVEAGEDFAVQAAMIRQFAAKIGQSALIDVVQIEGGYGYSQDMIASRLFRDVKGAVMMDDSTNFTEKVIATDVLA